MSASEPFDQPFVRRSLEADRERPQPSSRLFTTSRWQYSLVNVGLGHASQQTKPAQLSTTSECISWEGHNIVYYLSFFSFISTKEKMWYPRTNYFYFHTQTTTATSSTTQTVLFIKRFSSFSLIFFLFTLRFDLLFYLFLSFAPTQALFLWAGKFNAYAFATNIFYNISHLLSK